MKKKPYYKAIILGFTTVYLLAMILSTYLVMKNYEKIHQANIDTIINDLKSAFNYVDDMYTPETGNTEALYRGKITTLLSQSEVFRRTENEYQQISVAIYQNKKIAQTGVSCRILGSERHQYYCYSLSEFLSQEELSDLASFFGNRFSSDNFWSVTISPNQETNLFDTLDISVQTDLSEMVSEDNIWMWKNPKVDTSKITYQMGYTDHAAEVLFVPYASAGANQYEKWCNDYYLQNFPDSLSDPNAEFTDTIFTQHNQYVNGSIHRNNAFCIRETSQPLLGAINYMKYIYMISLLFVMACTAIIIRITNKTYEKRAALEETRRDFTNAIAHELKTPLGVIRGFSENIQEDTVAEKRDYYIQQIINQTESMDDLVQEMIYISKLDSEQLHLKKEPLSMKTLIEEQYKKLEPLANQKNLDIFYDIEDDFLFAGDKNYFEKAIWNLLSNAITYNRINGLISVFISKQNCSIVNTGTPIEDDALSHIFDMFYTGNKSRNSSGEKHFGLGLYFAKRIFELHHMNLTIQNTDDGVKAIISF